MKKYYIYYPRNFANEYSLFFCYPNSYTEKRLEEIGCEKITKKDAIQYCIDEKQKKKNQ